MSKSKNKGFIALPLIILFLLIIIAVMGYFLFTKNPISPTLTSTETPLATDMPVSATVTPESNSLGITTWSLTEIDNKLYIMQIKKLTNSKVKFADNNFNRSLKNVYSQDNEVSLEPEENTSIDTAKYNWDDVLSEPIKDSTGSISINVSDRLFSFKQIPNTKSIVFSIELSRAVSTSQGSSWDPYGTRRDLYLYDRSQSKPSLKKIISFSNTGTQYSYPKINSFSEDNKFVDVMLFGCWACDGHKPETLLVDLQTSKSQNIGKKSYFKWIQNGNYEYKDYIVKECDQPQPGECYEDPNTLPLKTGKI